METTFLFKRMYQFMWFTLYSKRKSILTSGGLAIGIWGLIFFTQINLTRSALALGYSEESRLALLMQVEAIQAALGFPMVTLGLWATSRIFSSIHNPSQNLGYLTLPASSLEKWIASWLLTGPILAFGFILLYFILSIGFCLSIGHPEIISTFLSIKIFSLILNYLYLQPIFLIGAVFFRKNQFTKTWLVIFIGGFIIANLIIRLIIGNGDHAISIYRSNIFTQTIHGLLSHLFFICISIFMLLSSYLLFKRKQA